MKTIWNVTRMLILIVVMGTGIANAHVPYIEKLDYSESRPFIVRNTIEQSIALYAWLETDGVTPSTDVDVARFEIEGPVRFFGELIVPVCVSTMDFAPWFLLAGPGLPIPDVLLPFELPDGYGAIVMPNLTPGEARETFYEPFGGKSYYSGPVLDIELEIPGVYYVYYWDPYQVGGDYVGVLGGEEIWNPKDIARGLYYTPYIRNDRELHGECVAP